MRVRFRSGHLPSLFALIGLIGLGGVEIKEMRNSAAKASCRLFVKSMSMGAYRQAEDEIERAINLCPNNSQYVSQKALLLAITAGVTCKGDDDCAAIVLGLNKYDLGKVENAIRLYQQALELKPDDDGFHQNLGWLYYVAGRREEAFKHLRKSVSIDRGNAIYHISIGLMLENSRDLPEAVAEYANALRLAPSILDSRFFHDLTQRWPDGAKSAFAAAASHLEGEIQTDGSLFARARLGKFYIYEKRYEKARLMIEECATQLPGLSYAWLHLGELYGMTGDEERMRGYYERAKFLDPGYSLAWARMGDFYYKKGLRREAVLQYSKAVTTRMNQQSDHARHIYPPAPGVADDLLPSRFLTYCSPDIGILEIYWRLSELYWEVGNDRMAKYFESMANR
jgi:tetratricopeptide (TPR) repeat protein